MLNVSLIAATTRSTTCCLLHHFGLYSVVQLYDVHLKKRSVTIPSVQRPPIWHIRVTAALLISGWQWIWTQRHRVLTWNTVSMGQWSWSGGGGRVERGGGMPHGRWKRVIWFDHSAARAHTPRWSIHCPDHFGSAFLRLIVCLFCSFALGFVWGRERWMWQRNVFLLAKFYAFVSSCCWWC